jgi:hypothetical protein
MYTSTIQKELVVAFPWQQWLGEGTTILLYTYIGYLNIFNQDNSFPHVISIEPGTL